MAKTDVFPNRAIQELTMSGANALTFAQMRFGMGLLARRALIVHRVEWHVPFGELAELASTADAAHLAITNRDDITALNAANMNCLVYKELGAVIVGAVVGLQLTEYPVISDFSTLPGGGLIIPPNPLFLAMDTAGWAGVGEVDMIMYYTIKELSDADYIELVQSLIPVNM